MKYGRTYNFSAGPAMMPEPVLEEIRDEMLNYRGSGMCVMEMSHRSPVFQQIIDEAEQDLRDLMGIPDNYKVLFIQGGATLQFAMIPLNFAVGGIGNYAVDGVWSRKAFNEAQKIGEAAEVACTELRAPRQDELAVTDGAAYLYYCSNETVNGIRYWYRPEVNVPLIADMSSDFLSQPVDISKYGLIFAGAQKNFGPAGLTVVIPKGSFRPRRVDNADHARLSDLCELRIDVQHTADLCDLHFALGLQVAACRRRRQGNGETLHSEESEDLRRDR